MGGKRRALSEEVTLAAPSAILLASSCSMLGPSSSSGSVWLNPQSLPVGERAHHRQSPREQREQRAERKSTIWSKGYNQLSDLSLSEVAHFPCVGIEQRLRAVYAGGVIVASLILGVGAQQQPLPAWETLWRRVGERRREGGEGGRGRAPLQVQ